MRQNGFVSLWVGNAVNGDALEKYVELGYSDDGELQASPFMIDFHLSRWDEDSREAQCQPSSVLIADLLRGASSEDQIVPQFERLIGAALQEPRNAVVLLFNYNHTHPEVLENVGEVRLRFIGVAQYDT